MRPHTTTPRPPAPNYAAVKRQRKGPAPLGDVTNLLLLPETPTPIKPGRPRLRTPSHSSSTCSSTAPITPAPKPPSSAAGDGKRKEKKRKEKKRKEKKVLDLETSVAFNCLRKAHDLQSVCNDVQLSDWLAMF
jgi:hypothetical protein